MKQSLILLIVLFSCSNSYPQQQDSIFNIMPIKGGKIFFDNVIPQDGSATEIWLKANQFFVDNFRDAKNVIELNDKENAIIIAKGYVPVTGGHCQFIMKVQCRENRYRVQMYDFVFEYRNPINYELIRIPLEEYEYIYKKEKRVKDFYYLVPGDLTTRLINTMSNTINNNDDEW